MNKDQANQPLPRRGNQTQPAVGVSLPAPSKKAAAARSARPTQPAPVRRVRQAPSPLPAPSLNGTDADEAGPSSDAEAALSDASEGAAQPSSSSAPARTAHSIKKDRLHQHWTEQTPHLRSELQHRAPLLQQFREDERRSILSILQQRLDAAWQLHPCCHLSNGLCSQQCLLNLPYRPVQYYCLTCHGDLQLPSYKCTECNQTFSPTAAQIGCFPATPVSAQTWFDITLLEAFVPLSLKLGVSGTGAIANSHSRHKGGQNKQTLEDKNHLLVAQKIGGMQPPLLMRHVWWL